MSAQHPTCEGRTWARGFGRNVRGLRAKVERNGMHYCGTHDPVAIKAREDKKKAERDAISEMRRKRYAEINAAQTERDRRADLFPELVEALQSMLDRYVSLVQCGDCGNWDAEAETQVIAARSALNKAVRS